MDLSSLRAPLPLHSPVADPRDIFDTILEEMLSWIAEAGSIDGVLLELHGSMVVVTLTVRTASTTQRVIF